MTSGARNADKFRWPWRLVALAAFVVVVGASTWAWSAFRPKPLPSPPELSALDGDAAEGAYLATIGNCAACHTRPDGPAYAGGVRFETPFGVLHSTNITPDPNSGIGAWSFGDFYQAMKHGVRPDGSHLYPAFPYTFFAEMDDRDIASVFLHLQTLDPQAAPAPSNEMYFPFGERRLLHFWKRLFHNDGDVARTPAPDARDRGAYLVEAVAHCGACHTPRNLLGGLDENRPLAGGVYIDQVASGAYRTWSTPDITNGRGGLAHWSADDMRDYLLEGANAHTVVHGPMVEVFHATAQLRRDDAQAIANYLDDFEGARNGLRISLPNWGSEDGETVYTVHCGSCHLPDGGGDPTLGVSLRENPLVQAEDPSTLINVILYGPQLPPAPFTVSRTRMKPFGRRLSDDDIAAVTTYLRSNFGNDASAVRAEDVRRQR